MTRLASVMVVLAGLLTVATPVAARSNVYPDVIALPDGFFPEGIAVGTGNDVYAGSLANGAIWRLEAALSRLLERLMALCFLAIFLIGFWGAVFSSLLGVWQSIPYLFVDFILIRQASLEIVVATGVGHRWRSSLGQSSRPIPLH